MTTTVELALRAGRMAARLGKPLSECPYDPDADGEPAEALAFARGWNQIASMEDDDPDPGDDQTASVDIHGNQHSERDGKFTKKTDAEKITDLTRRIGELQKKIRESGSESQIGRLSTKKAELEKERHELGGPKPSRVTAGRRVAPGSREGRDARALDARNREDLNTIGFVGQADQARDRLHKAEIMHGSDRSKWTAKDRAAAARLDKVIAKAEIDEAIRTGSPDGLAGVDRPELMKVAKARGVKVPRGASADAIRSLLVGAKDPGKQDSGPQGPGKVATAVSKIDDVVAQYEAGDAVESGPSEERIRAELKDMKLAELKETRAALGGTVSKMGKTKAQIVDDIVRGTVGFRAQDRFMRDQASKTPLFSGRQPKKPLTSKMNAHSFGRGQQFWEHGEIYTVRGHRQVTKNGVGAVELDVTDSEGRSRILVKYLNEPLDRVIGGAGGGSGTFSAEFSDSIAELFKAQLLTFGVDPQGYTIQYDVRPILEHRDQVAAVGDYDKAHGIHRDNSGRFGRGTRLGQVLQDLAGGSDDDEADNFRLDSGASFDWAQKDHNGDRLVDVVGTHISDDDEIDDEDEDAEIEPAEPDSGLSRLHMSQKDMKRWASTMGTALLREQMLATGLDPDDPKTHLLVSMLESQSYNDVEFDDSNPWDQSLRLYPQSEGRWSMFVSDNDGDEVEVPMSTAELTALHAQVMRQVLDDNDAPRRESLARMAAKQQTAAVVAAEFAMPEQLENYWLHDPEALAKIRWCTRGAFRRARRALLAEGVPAAVVNGTVANLYQKACGRPPGRKKGGHEMSSEDPDYVALAQFPTQNACGCAGADHEAAAGVAPLTAIGPLEVDLPAPDDAPSTSTGWRGPLAPVDIATGDKRKFAPGALGSRSLPLPFRWQERQERGHDGAVVVGALTGYAVLTEPLEWEGVILPAGTIMGEGYFLDEEVIPDVAKAKHLAKHKVVGPSVDLEPTMQVTYVDKETGNAFNPNECAHTGSCPDHGEAVITDATITAATLVPITAFADCRAPQMFTRTVAQDAEFAAGAATLRQTAAARFVDWDDVPIAEAGTPWDPAGARERLREWARAEDLPVGEAETDWRRFSLGFLHADEAGPAGYPDVEAGYYFQIVDIIDGQPTIVPEAVFAASTRVDSATLGSTAKREIRETLEDLYGQLAEEFGMDDELHAPWAREHQVSSGASASCGCADKWAAMGTQTASTDFDVFAGMPPYPADAFNVQLDRLTPITIEQRPGEPFARVFGHAASWKSCNRGYRGVCVPPPRSATGYSQFHLGAVRTDQGLLSVGKIVQGEGHPDTGTGARIARAFYDRTSKTTALVRADDDKFGVKVAGVVAPGVSAEEATMLLASPPSGDWKDGEMIAVLAVNVPGHVVPRATMVDGQPRNMVAAGRFWPDEDHEDVAAEMHLLGLSFSLLEEQLWAQDAPMLVATLQGEGI